LLCNHSYPPRYIQSQFKQFFKNYLSIPSVLPLVDTETDFATIGRQLLSKPTISEHRRASRIAKTIDNENKDTVDNTLVKTKLDQESKWINNLIIHYTHEKRLATYKNDIHQVWNQTFTQIPILSSRHIIGSRNS
jgi:hypothetical protein